MLKPIWISVRSTLEPILRPLQRAIGYVTSSFFRFMILFGLVFVGIGILMGEGIVAGHLGIYGWTAVGIGIVGRVIIHWKIKDR